MIALIAFLFVKIMDFNAFKMSEDEDMHRKKVYDNVSHYADTVEHAEIITSKNTMPTDNKCLGSITNHIKTNSMKIINWLRCVINKISSKCMAEFSLNAMKQTIATNEGVLEYGILPPKYSICLKLFEIIF